MKVAQIRRRSEASGGPKDRTLLIVASRDPLRLTSVRRRPWDRTVARLRALALDRDLAADDAPDGSRLHAVRAAMLVAPRTRRQLAHRWDELPRTAAQLPRPGDPRIPLARTRILSAAREIAELSAALRVQQPVPVRGVALANLLLIDGAGPLYAGYSRQNLRQALGEAVRRLDPSIALAGSALGG